MHQDRHNEFYEHAEWPKIFRDLMTYHTPLPFMMEYPAPSRHEKSWKKCCGGREYICKYCEKTFDKASSWMRHVKKVHMKR